MIAKCLNGLPGPPALPPVARAGSPGSDTLQRKPGMGVNNVQESFQKGKSARLRFPVLPVPPTGTKGAGE